MTQIDYLIILLTLVIYRPLKIATLATKPRMLHHWDDLLGSRHERRLQKLDRYFGSRSVPPVVATLLSLIVYPTMHWKAIDPTQSLRIVVGVAAVMLAWKSATMDVDLATGRRLIGPRLVMLLAAAGVIFYPGFIFLLLFTAANYFRGWQHHQHLQFRISLIVLSSWLAYLILSATMEGLPPVTAATWFAVLLIPGAQYAVAGVSKCRLGKRWYSWILHNRLDYLTLAAYQWGWSWFLTEERVIRWANRMRTFNRSLQASAVLMELATACALFDRHVAMAVFCSLVVFHATVFLLVGLLFWQNMAVLATLAGALYFLPEAVSSQIFNPVNGTLGCALVFTLTMGLKLWRPPGLSWWDTPLVARTDWRVEGVSGQVYGLYNDFMAPNDRIFGNSSGYFLSKRKRMTRHCGHIKKWERAHEINEALSDPAQLQKVVERLGAVPYREHEKEEHDRYMLAFFTNFNRGVSKSVCPRWLKAPGGQLFYWGRLPRFLGQEPVRRVTTHFREVIFDGTKFVTLQDEPLEVLEIPLSGEESMVPPEEASVVAAAEPTTEQVDRQQRRAA